MLLRAHPHSNHLLDDSYTEQQLLSDPRYIAQGSWGPSKQPQRPWKRIPGRGTQRNPRLGQHPQPRPQPRKHGHLLHMPCPVSAKPSRIRVFDVDPNGFKLHVAQERPIARALNGLENSNPDTCSTHNTHTTPCSHASAALRNRSFTSRQVRNSHSNYAHTHTHCSHVACPV